MKKGALIPDSGPTDFIVNDKDYDTVWLTWGNYSICLHKTDEGLFCDMFRAKHEDDGEVASCYAFDTEVQDDNG